MAFLGNASGSSTSTGSFAKILAADTLHVDGLITQGGVGSGTQNIMIGRLAGGAPGNTGTIRSVFIGEQAASKITTGDNGVAIGYLSGGSTATAAGTHNQFVAIGGGAAAQVKDASSAFTVIGYSAAFASVKLGSSTIIGHNAACFTLSGSSNTFIGASAGSSAGSSNGETPNNNIAIGISAFSSAGDATLNVAVGNTALRNITGNNNVAIGTSALEKHVDGDNNIAIGYQAMYLAGNDGGTIDNQIAIGAGALKNIDTFGTKYANIAIGQESFSSVVSSSFNIVMGYRSMYSATGIGGANTVIGNSAGYAASGSTFHANVIIGDYAGYQTKGGDNVLVGEYAGHDLTSGNANVVIGSTAARFSNTFETNTNSVLVGYRTEASANGNTNENIFGYNATGLGSNTVTLGNNNVTDIYMAQDSGATIHAAGISGSAGNLALIGDISGSSTSTGSFARVLAADTLNVGGGIDSENGVLHVEGLITQGGVGSGTQGIAIGTNAGGGNTGSTRSVYIGASAASTITTGDNNVAIGFNSGGAVGTALGSHAAFVAVGSYAGYSIKDNSTGFTMVGQGAGSNSVMAPSSTFIGAGAGANMLSGSTNTLIGNGAGGSAGNANGETPNNNIAIGYRPMYAAGDATYNIAVGDQALKNITGFNNTAIGKNALNGHIDGDGNIAIGADAMSIAGADGKTVDSNTAMGGLALKSLETGTHNVAIGTNALQNAVTSSHNIAIGYRSMFSNNHLSNPIKGTFGSSNVVIGSNAAYASTGSSFHANVILGPNAGGNTKGKENVLIGEYAGHDLESGQHNVVVGAQSARFSNTFETNTDSVLVGYRCEASANGNSNENVFGHNTTGLGSNTVTLGNNMITDIYMAQDSGATIHAAGISGSAGSLALIGDISGSSTSTGSFGRVEATTLAGDIIGQRPITTHTANFTASMAYAGNYNIVHGNLTCSIKVHATSSVATGTEYEFFQTSSVGNMLFEIDPGVTVFSKNDNLNIAGQSSGASLKKVDTDTWHLVGDLT